MAAGRRRHYLNESYRTDCAGDADGGADDGVQPVGDLLRHLPLPTELFQRGLPGTVRRRRQHRRQRRARVLRPLLHRFAPILSASG